MLSAVLGTLIISALTTALMLSIQFAEKFLMMQVDIPLEKMK